MATSMDTHKRKVTIGLHLSNLLSFCISRKPEIVCRCIVIGLLARPFKSFSPSSVAEPIADKVSVTLRAMKRLVAISRMLKGYTNVTLTA
jgi:hypothetical protein